MNTAEPEHRTKPKQNRDSSPLQTKYNRGGRVGAQEVDKGHAGGRQQEQDGARVVIMVEGAMEEPGAGRACWRCKDQWRWERRKRGPNDRDKAGSGGAQGGDDGVMRCSRRIGVSMQLWRDEGPWWSWWDNGPSQR